MSEYIHAKKAASDRFIPNRLAYKHPNLITEPSLSK